MAKRKETEVITESEIVLYEHHIQADGSFKVYDRQNYRYVVAENTYICSLEARWFGYLKE